MLGSQLIEAMKRLTIEFKVPYAAGDDFWTAHCMNRLVDSSYVHNFPDHVKAQFLQRRLILHDVVRYAIKGAMRSERQKVAIELRAMGLSDIAKIVENSDANS